MLYIFLDVSQVMGTDFHNTMSLQADGPYSDKINVKKKPNKPKPPPEIKKPTEAERLAAEEKLKEEKKPFGYFSFSIIPSRLRIAGEQVTNKSKGVINSKNYYTTRLSYTHIYHNWKFSGAFSFKKFEAEPSDNQVILNPKQNTFLIDLQGLYYFNQLYVGGGIGTEGRVFYRSVSSTNISIEKRTEERLWAALGYAFKKNQKNSLIIGTRAGVTLPSKSEIYDVKTGQFFTAFLRYEHKYKANQSVGIETFYKHNEYETNKLKLNSTEIGIGLSFSLYLGDRK